ncbi:GNAT family N-acetyltransferase [Desulfovibrio inopinatus]|uniref:GNAT family N-acetyltransferase n=1 Tax=Desulfovibrio inopinatus TaxID=102109 RepID=UPI00040AC679|nr:GNAT family N-acetyltransferase [Desulfovibrio inopinatus]
MRGWIEFETARLVLRQWKETDKKTFAVLNADPRVMEFFPAPLTRKESDAVADKCQLFIEEHGWGFWAVEEKRTHDFLGFVGLYIPRADLPFSPCVEIGWRLAFPYWGKGVASEAAKGALAIGFCVLNLKEIVSFTAFHNVRSQAVMRRIGMHRVPGSFAHPGVAVSSPLREHLLYRLADRSWRQQENEIQLPVHTFVSFV